MHLDRVFQLRCILSLAVLCKLLDNLSLADGASFPGGRIVGTDSGAVPYYYLTDHLGSTRAIIDGFSGEVVERDDYYPFGSRWNSGPEVPWNRYRFNGKEWQTFSGLPYIDYGARLYDPQWSLSWNAIDMMSEKYYSVSPYAFCSGNPVNFAIEQEQNEQAHSVEREQRKAP